MADVIMLEPFQLYNLLNQQRDSRSRLQEINYLCLMDAREVQDFFTSHIITAKNAKLDSNGSFLMSELLEVDSMQHVVVYDNNTGSLQDKGRAVHCAQTLAKASLCPVHVVRGGFQKFTALYPFLRTEKILYTNRELENLKIYPLEVLPELLYVGDQRQVTDPDSLQELKIRAVVNISLSDTDEFWCVDENQAALNIPVEDPLTSDLCSHFDGICSFIDSHLDMGSRVLIVSRHVGGCCTAVTIAFLMHHLLYTMEEAWRYMLTCQPKMRPNEGDVQQLSEWELRTKGEKLTDISLLDF